MFTESIGGYLSHLPAMSFRVGALGGDVWLSAWTIFYWAWWISWAPFVGVFIARISRGRTIREFIAGVLLVPTIVGFFWFSVMGGAGLFRQLFGEGGLVGTGDEGEPEVDQTAALFNLLDGLPGSGDDDTTILAVRLGHPN